MPVRVAIVDDTEHVREMLASMLILDGFEVVGRGSSGPEALAIAVGSHPDVIVLDYQMPGMNGLEAARRIRDEVPRQAIILYTAYLDNALEQAAREAGVALCVGKVEGIETLERNISSLCLQLAEE